MYVGTYICAAMTSLEKEIHQKAFRCPHEKLIVNLLYTGSWLKNKHAASLKEFDLTGPQFNVLRILKGQYPKPATVNMLIQRMLDKSSNASRIVDKLVSKGLVVRKVSETDRRRVEVLIAEKGIERLSQANNSVDQILEEIKQIHTADVDKVNKFLDDLRTTKS